MGDNNKENIFVRLEPAQIQAFWPEIELAVRDSNGELSGLMLDRLCHTVKSNLLSGGMDAWLSANVDDKSFDLVGVAVTGFQWDGLVGARVMYINALKGFSSLSRRELSTGLKAMLRYAKFNACVKMGAYTMKDNVEKISSALGASHNKVLMEWPC